MSNPRDSIQFLLDGVVTSIDFNAFPGLKPTTTVLNYLRSLPFHKGVKEGCAEGDCGACTVVIAENCNGRLKYRAVDSCLVFLPMLHGKQLITVENLASGSELHPVQQALVNHYGSQCGYCTPGIVMSLFALYKNYRNPGRQIVGDALTGNLCRCTGYQSIIEAAEAACQGEDNDKFAQHEENTVRRLMQIATDKSPIQILTPKQKYYKPFTLADALDFRKLYPESLVVSGATDVALHQTKKRELLSGIIDISDVSGLNYFREDENTFLLGSGLPLEILKKHSQEKLPALHEILEVFGSLQIRNLATLGGNAGSASPIGDMLPILYACKAIIKLQSTDTERLVSIEDFIKGYRTTDIRESELITAIHIPKPDPETITKSYKVSKRKEMDISSVSACFSLSLRNETVKEIILAFGGMASQPKRATQTERFLAEKPWTRLVVEEAMQILYREFSPISDARAGAEYRNLVARNLLMKFYLDTLTVKP